MEESVWETMFVHVHKVTEAVAARPVRVRCQTPFDLKLDLVKMFAGDRLLKNMPKFNPGWAPRGKRFNLTQPQGAIRGSNFKKAD